MKELELNKIPDLPFDVTEALNQLRINLGFCGDQIKTIMVTSSVPNEGKSFVTMQLWKMIAEVGTPAILIDCDLRNSEMRRKYGVRILRNEKLLGVPHYLAGQAEIEDVIYKTNVPNGYMIPVTSARTPPFCWKARILPGCWNTARSTSPMSWWIRRRWAAWPTR